MADGVRELGTVQGIEVKLVHAVFLQRMHLFDGHRGGNQLARLGVVFQPVEAVFQPVGNRSAAALGEARDLLLRHFSEPSDNARRRRIALIGLRGGGKSTLGRLAAERLGVEPRLCLALEDSHNGVRSASAAGMMTVMVPDLLDPTDEIRALCAFVAHDLHEVRRVILASS